MYIKKVLSGLSILALVLGLTGCLSIGLEFPVSKTGFPTGFTRISDGVQVYLGMTRDEVREVLVVTNERGEEIASSGSLVNYGAAKMDGWFQIEYYNNIAISIMSMSTDWAINGGFSTGDNIRSIVDSNSFTNLRHSSGLPLNTYDAVDIAKNPTYALSFGYNSDENITVIHLGYFQYWMSW